MKGNYFGSSFFIGDEKVIKAAVKQVTDLADLLKMILLRENKRIGSSMITQHPTQGTILICDFDGLKEPEMVKRRPVIVVSKPIVSRPGLCTVVPLSTTEPKKILPMHYKLELVPPLPKPYDSPSHWVKGDMIYAFSFKRLTYPFKGKDLNGTRIYDIRSISLEQLICVQKCILAGLGIFKS